MSSALRPLVKTKMKLLTSFFLVLILLLPPLVNVFIARANAGSLSNFKVQINNSQAAATNVTYSIFFTTTATTSIKRVEVQICTTASGTCTSPGGFSPGSPTLASDNLAGTGRTTTDPNTTGIRFRTDVTTPSTQSTQNVFLNYTGITNPSAINTTSYARVTTYSDTIGTIIDGTTTAAFAVLDTNSIAVSATVDPNFTFTVAPATTGSVNGDTINVSSTTASSIPYGTLNTTTASVSAHDLTVITNASNGYQITASSAANTQTGFPPLVSGATNNIDNFTGSNATPTTWSAPGGTSANVNTGFFGYTTNDATLCSGTANRFTNSGPNYAGFTTVGQEIACNSAPVSTETTRVGWKLAINSIQPAGGYTGTIILVATPTY